MRKKRFAVNVGLFSFILGFVLKRKKKSQRNYQRGLVKHLFQGNGKEEKKKDRQFHNVSARGVCVSILWSALLLHSSIFFLCGEQ